MCISTTLRFQIDELVGISNTIYKDCKKLDRMHIYCDCWGRQAFNREAIEYYMPTLVEVADRRLNSWADASTKVRGISECKDLAFDVATVVLISDMTVCPY